MAGYYDEITGEYIDTGDGSAGYGQLDDTSGTDAMEGWSLNNGVWTDPQGGVYDMSYLDSSEASRIGGILKSLGSGIAKQLTNTFTKPDGSINWAGVGTAAMALYGQMKGSGDTGGYNKPVPKMGAAISRVQYDDTNRRPGEQGRKYFTDPQFYAQGDAAAQEAAQSAAATEAAGLAALAPQQRPQQVNPYAGKMNLEALRARKREQEDAQQPAGLPEIPQAQGLKMAQGGIANLAKGGRYLAGATDGMADKLPTTIDGKHPAALSHGEFVIPADVVSHLGNGNSEAGAKKLYEMMAKVRKARTGNEKQGKQINPDKFMPGGLAAVYAAGGEVKTFQEGGTTTTATSAGGVPLDTSRTSTLSPWVGDYVTTALGQGAALADQPYQAYTGTLTAGPSSLQQQAFAGASELAGAGYEPTTFSAGTFDTAAANKYMNPYLSAALQPQLDEARRQAQISRLADASRLTKAGAFGGSRQAIMESELNRNLMDKQNQLLSSGYATAYDKAMAQFNADQARQMEAEKAGEGSRQFGAQFAVTGLKSLADLGATERAIEQEGLTADKTQFEQSRDWAYKMPQYKLNLLQGLPIGAQTTTTDQDALSKLQSDIAGLSALYKSLEKLGQTQT